MKLSEKSIELSFCSQLAERLSIRDAIWFGLTQKQEREMGFDACSSIDGHLLILQFKASKRFVNLKYSGEGHKTKSRRYTVPHEQLSKLKQVSAYYPDCVYYLFPDIGDTSELITNRDLISQSWLLNVEDIRKNIEVPSNKGKEHYAYMAPPKFELRSKPQSVQIYTPYDVINKINQLPFNSKKMSECYQNNSQNKESEALFDGLKAYGLLWSP